MEVHQASLLVPDGGVEGLTANLEVASACVHKHKLILHARVTSEGCCSHQGGPLCTFAARAKHSRQLHGDLLQAARRIEGSITGISSATASCNANLFHNQGISHCAWLCSAAESTCCGTLPCSACKA